DGAGPTKVTLDPAVRAGVLTQASVLTGLSKADSSSPVLRGKFVRERLLCGRLSPPPNDVKLMLPDPAPGITTRARYEAHLQVDECSGCHRQMDPIGFGFEGFDAIGRARTEDEGEAVDTSGSI